MKFCAQRAKAFAPYCDAIWMETYGYVSQVTARDLNGDGYTDLISASYGGDYSSIYWGSETGPSPTDVTDLPTEGATGVRAAGPGIPALFSVN